MSKKFDLIEIKNNGFYKISKFFKNLYNKLFRKNKYKENNEIAEIGTISYDIQNATEPETKIDIEKILYEYIEEDYQPKEYNYEEMQNYSDEKTKKEFFKLYYDIKNNMRTIDSLNTIELIQLNLLLKEEKKLLNKM